MTLKSWLTRILKLKRCIYRIWSSYVWWASRSGDVSPNQNNDLFSWARIVTLFSLFARHVRMLKNLNKTPSPPATMCIHLSISLRTVESPSAESVASSSASSLTSSFSWTRISIKSSPSRSKSSRENLSQAEAKSVGFWQSFWLNRAFNEIGNSAEIARAWPYYLTRLPSILKLLILLQLLFSFQFFLLWLLCCAMASRQLRWWWMKTRGEIVPQ